MDDELMSCLTCLRVQLEKDMLTVENPARGGASMASFKLCMGCASAIAQAVAELRQKLEVTTEDKNQPPASTAPRERRTKVVD
jgi:hypothetical protein